MAQLPILQSRCNDSHDHFALGLAAAAGARYNVTQLKDFAGVEKFGIQAVAPARTLWKQLFPRAARPRLPA